MLSNPALKSRFCASGPLLDNVHLVDLFLYDSSLFANVLIVEDSQYTLIIDAGTAATVGAIKNYLYFNRISLEHVLILPTHHHFDHTGGIGPLQDFIKKQGGNSEVLLTPIQEKYLTQPECVARYREEAIKAFHDTVGQLGTLDPSTIKRVKDNEIISLGHNWEVTILFTPGHSKDHITPILTDGFGEKLAFFGEAMGINLENDLHPIPASSAPDFRLDDYRASIKRILREKPEVGIFSHFGGIQGQHSIQRTGRYALQMLTEFENEIKRLYSENSSTRYIANAVFNKYAREIATVAVNSNLARNLAFTIVYGFLQELGLKPRKKTLSNKQLKITDKKGTNDKQTTTIIQESIQ